MTLHASTTDLPPAAPTTRKVGLVGGMSWHSTLEYYRAVNREVQDTLGGHHSARLGLESLDFDLVRRAQVDEDWEAAGELLGAAAERLVAAGADGIAICTNLMHKVAPQVAARVDVPLLHIAEAVGDRLARDGLSTAAVLGARQVMEEDFYEERLAARGVQVLVPGDADRGVIDEIIFEELTRGVVSEGARAEFVRIMDDLAGRGAQAVTLSCTEIEHLFRDGRPTPLPLVDSTAAHTRALARFCLGST